MNGARSWHRAGRVYVLLIDRAASDGLRWADFSKAGSNPAAGTGRTGRKAFASASAAAAAASPGETFRHWLFVENARLFPE